MLFVPLRGGGRGFLLRRRELTDGAVRGKEHAS